MLMPVHITTATATATATTTQSFLLKHHALSLICLFLTLRKNMLTSV